MRSVGFILCVVFASLAWSARSEGAIEFSPFVKPQGANSASSGGSGQASSRKNSTPVVGSVSGGSQGQANLGRGRRRLSRSNSNIGSGQIGGSGSSVTSSTTSGLSGQLGSVIDPQQDDSTDGDGSVDDGNGTGGNGTGGNGTGGNGAATPEPTAVVLWSVLIGVGCLASRVVAKRSA